MDDEVGLGVAIRVVGECVSEIPQPLELPGGRGKPGGKHADERKRGIGQVVAERGDDRPDALAAAQVAIDEDAGAHVGGRVDQRVQSRARGDLACIMMIEIFDADAALEQLDERCPVAVERNVEHGDGVVGAHLRCDALQQGDVALHAGDERGVHRRVEAQLLQCADAVGITVEYVEVTHRLTAAVARSAGMGFRPRPGFERGSV